ncbi:28738_t:CDS:1, partial [Gigaspora margarita]
KVEELNEDVARVILVDENESPIDTIEKAKFINKATENEITPVEVKNQKSYLITWINSYELRIDNEKIFKFKAQKGHVQMKKNLADCLEDH